MTDKSRQHEMCQWGKASDTVRADGVKVSFKQSTD